MLLNCRCLEKDEMSCCQGLLGKEHRAVVGGVSDGRFLCWWLKLRQEIMKFNEMMWIRDGIAASKL